MGRAGSIRRQRAHACARHVRRATRHGRRRRRRASDRVRGPREGDPETRRARHRHTQSRPSMGPRHSAIGTVPAACMVRADRRDGPTQTRGWGLGAGGCRSRAPSPKPQAPVRNPLIRGRQHLLCRPLHNLEIRAAAVQTIVIELEAGVQAEAGVQDEGSDEGGGAVAGGRERAGERGLGPIETEGAVVAHTVARRIQAAHDRGMGRQRHRHVGMDRLEPPSFAREPIERRREAAAASVGADVIGAQRVDGDQQHVGAAQRGRRNRFARRRTRATAGRGGGHGGKQEQQATTHRARSPRRASVEATRAMSFPY